MLTRMVCGQHRPRAWDRQLAARGSLAPLYPLQAQSGFSGGGGAREPLHLEGVMRGGVFPACS